MLPLQAELEDEERDRILDRLAREVTRRGLEVPVVLALEMHRPLAFLSSQALIVFTPMFGPAFGVENMQKLTKLLEDPENLNRLMDRIEELAAERRAARPEEQAAGPEEAQDPDAS